MSSDHLLECRNISKSFGSVQALDGVDFHIDKGEVVGLVGDNGAGKSTLLKVLVGVHEAESGEIYWKGEKTKISSPKDAQKLGISILHQNLPVIPNQNLTQNFFLGREKTKGILNTLDKEKMDEICRRELKSMEISKDLIDQQASTLSGGEEQALILARTYYFGSELIFLDEPTNNLSIKETRKILKLTSQLNENKGIPIVYVTHNISRVYSVADRFVILDRARKIADIEKTKDLKVKDVEDIVIKGGGDERFIFNEEGIITGYRA